MKERPILISAPMVRAILAGTKTQTRRVVTMCRFDVMRNGWPYDCTAHSLGRPMRCPCGQPGDRLWVRESVRAHELLDKEAEDDTYGIIETLGLELPPYGLDGVIYTADNTFRPIDNTREAADAWMTLRAYRGGADLTVPAIHMPRWASRIDLDITEVRVERLQDISEADAIAEGIQEWIDRGIDHDGYPRDAFRSLWESINGPGSWDTNPLVWVVKFAMASK